ncbi:MAG: addiction module protein [Gammaproteobacteria bacterium]
MPNIALKKMSVEEKLQLMEALWADLRAGASTPPRWHGEILAARASAVERGEERFVDWEAAKKSLHEKLP